jgi:hypothetical protein
MRRIFWYLAPHTTFSTGMSLLDMFVGFYLFRFGSGSYLAPLAFSMAGWIMVPPAQAICAGFSHRITLPNALRVGALATGLTFAGLAVLATTGAEWWAIVPVGISYGVVRSIYWQARTQVDYRLAHEIGAPSRARPPRYWA